MKDRKKFYVKMVIFHLVVYPFMTWFLVSGINNDRLAQSFLIWVFAIGMISSMTWTCIIPLMRLKKEEKKLESQRVTNGNINNDYIN